MRAAREHPRLAIAIAAGLILLALCGAAAGRALQGAQTTRTSDSALRAAEREQIVLRQRLQAAEAHGVQLRGQVQTLTVQLERSRRPPPPSPPAARTKPRESKR